MKRIRLEMGMPIVIFGIEVLGSNGDFNTVSKWVRRLEALNDDIDDKTARKVMARYRQWCIENGKPPPS